MNRRARTSLLLLAVLVFVVGGMLLNIQEQRLTEQHELELRRVEARGFMDGEAMGLRRGHDEGYQEGFDRGRDDGYEMGYEEGYQEGYDEGYELGILDFSP
ncbi:MAG: hypothetical protein DYH08_06340 [Actinobacteria bacterium ATB1]|nr:hypothetical protein [Actinobacteria bacterium ATB1]